MAATGAEPRSHPGVRAYLGVVAPHFHVCNGPRPGGHFLQSEAWEGRKVVIESVCRTIENAIRLGDDVRGDSA